MTRPGFIKFDHFCALKSNNLLSESNIHTNEIFVTVMEFTESHINAISFVCVCVCV